MGAEIRGTRLERAKRLLIETKMPVAEVAQQSGFSDFRQMAVAFRKVIQQTPSQFRRTMHQTGI